MSMETTHAFTEGEWLLVRTIANGLEWSYGWQAAAAQRLRFMLDFGYATGLRISELADATLRSVEADAVGDHWLHVIGKGGKPARVTLTPLARAALDRYLQERGLPVSRVHWHSATPLIGSLDESGAGISHCVCGKSCAGFSGSLRRSLKTTIRWWPRNSVRRYPTG
jgi:integrase